MAFNWYVALAGGEVIVIVGGFLSTLLPVIGPAVVHPPSLLHTWRLFVAALAVSVPIGTAVVRVKFASAAFASPDSVSLAVHVIVTLLLCHAPSDAPHDTCGGVESTPYTSAEARPLMPSWPPASSTLPSERRVAVVLVRPVLILAVGDQVPRTES